MKVKIVSDGTRAGTKVVNAETGELIQNVTAIVYTYAGKDCFSHCKLDIVNVEMDVVAEDPTKKIDPNNPKNLVFDPLVTMEPKDVKCP